MHVAGDAFLPHLVDERVAELLRGALDAREHEVPRRREVVPVMLDKGKRQVRQPAFVALDDLATTREKARVAAQLRQTKRRLQVGHVALPAAERHVVFPCADARFRERVFRLAVKRHQHKVAIELLRVEPGDIAPGERTALCRGEILHRMEGKRREVGRLSRMKAMAHRTERMRTVGDDGHAIEELLAGRARAPCAAHALKRGAQAIVVAHDTRHIDGDDGASLLGDKARHLVVVNLERARCHVAEYRGRAHMHNRARRRSVGVSARDDLVTWPDAERAQGAFERRRRGVEAGKARRMAEFRQIALELLGLRTGGDPAASERIGHLVDFSLGNIGRGKGNVALHVHEHAVLSSPLRARRRSAARGHGPTD